MKKIFFKFFLYSIVTATMLACSSNDGVNALAHLLGGPGPKEMHDMEIKLSMQVADLCRRNYDPTSSGYGKLENAELMCWMAAYTYNDAKKWRK